MSTTGEMKMDSDEIEKTQRKNYERMIFAIAVLYSDFIGVDIKKQIDYSHLDPSQKMFAKKIYEDTPSLAHVVQQPERITEHQIVESTADIAKSRDNSRQVRIVTVGDEKVCPACAAWRNRIVSLDNSSSPTLDDAINAGFLHYGCRCSLQETSTTEIPLNKNNPRYQTRKAANPAVYHCAARFNGLVFT